MDEAIAKQLVAGKQVRVIQQIPRRDRASSDSVEGMVLAYEQRQTGSWFAHSKNDKLWLDRLVLKKSDGEIITLNLDGYSRIELM